MLVAHRPHRADVRQAHRLAAAGVVGDGDHDDRDVLGPDLGDEGFERGDVHVALEGVLALGVLALGDGQVDGPGSRVLDIGERGVEVGVVGDDLALAADKLEEDAFAGPPLVRRQDVDEACDFLESFFEAEERLGAGVALVAPHDARPLLGGHRPRARVGQQVDDDMAGAEEEGVEAGGPQVALALLGRGHGDRLDGLDAEGLDDGLHGVVSGADGNPPAGPNPCSARTEAGGLPPGPKRRPPPDGPGGGQDIRSPEGVEG